MMRRENKPKNHKNKRQEILPNQKKKQLKKKNPDFYSKKPSNLIEDPKGIPPRKNNLVRPTKGT